MVRYLLLLFTVIHFNNGLTAQHCPFDGASIVVLHLTCNDSAMDNLAHRPVFLCEKENPLADSCKYAAGQLKLLFDIPQKNLVEKYEGEWAKRSARYLQQCRFSKPGYFVVVLNQAQESCIIDKKNQYSYLKRQFELQLQTPSGKIRTFPVPEDCIFPLCTGSGNWDRITALEVQYPLDQ